MVAPDTSNSFVTLILSLRVIPSGNANNADEPPDTRKITSSSLFLWCQNFRMFLAARTLVLSGVG